MRRLSVVIFIFSLVLIGSSIFSQGNEEEKKTGVTSPDGFGILKWETPISEAKEKVIGKIVFYDERRAIVTRDEDIEYLYGFFYMDPEVLVPEEEPVSKVDKKHLSDEKSFEAKLFYVSVRFPYLTITDVRKRIEEKYGPPTGEDIKDNQGAIIWDSDKTTIIMWVDRYEGRPFCMKINYIGKGLAKEINEYQKLIFNKTEIDVLKRLSF